MKVAPARSTMEGRVSEEIRWFVGFDWAHEQHRVCLLDGAGKRVAERDVPHDGAGLAQLCEWLIETTATTRPGALAVAIETPRGPVVEALLERGFQVFAINPKQLDRFRDRFSVAGAKDDSRDALVLGHSLRTDRDAFRRLTIDDPLVIELREWSRIDDELKDERTRLTNRVRDQLWRYYPQAGAITDDVAADWFLDLWDKVPGPAQAARVTEKTIARILKKHRIRRFDAAELLRRLRQPALVVAPGTVAAAMAHIGTLSARLRLVNQQIKQAERRLDEGSSISRSSKPSAGWTNCADQSRTTRGRSASSATLRSCVPVQGSEGSHSPRCSPRPASLCADEIIMCCDCCRASPR